MEEIYGNAETVHVWLGSDDESAEAMMAPSSDDSTRALRQACRALADKTYWTRQCIWQELLLSKDAVLACGRYSMPLVTFRWYAQMHPEFSSGTPGHLLNIWSQPGYYSLLHALLTFNFCQCKDPRDKVFAVLNMLYADERAALPMLPDYSLSVGQVALQAISHIRSFTAHVIYGQSEICKKAEKLLCGLDATPGHKIKSLAQALKKQSTELFRATSQMLPLQGLR
jgi:hypothetical protein